MTLLDATKSGSREGGPSFSLNHRLLRLAWIVTWNCLGRWTPRPMFGWRRFLLRCFGAKMDKTARVYPSVRVWYPPNLVMKKQSCLGPEVNCYCMDRIELGEYALVSQHAYLCGGTHNVDDINLQLITKPIIIGNNAWVCAASLVGPGVIIGDNAVLGAGAVTFKNLEPGSIYIGNPAKFLRKRNIPERGGG